jgi:hypothetical protein
MGLKAQELIKSCRADHELGVKNSALLFASSSLLEYSKAQNLNF